MKYAKQIAFLAILFLSASLTPSEAAEYGVARSFTPVLNTPGFKEVFGGGSGQDLKADRCGQVRELEYIAPPGTVFRILEQRRSGTAPIYRVETDEYVPPPDVPLYVDGRFLKLEDDMPPPRRASLPPRELIVSELRSSAGTPYVWGGNVPEGVPELAKWYFSGLNGDDGRRLTLAGLDCSGLLYHATGGWTPRNTTDLIAYGQGVAIAGKRSAEIAALLQPLDLIVWSGHVVIVLDRQTAVESRLECGKAGNGGVVMTQLSTRIAEIMRTRRPADSWPGGKKRRDLFVVRRWYGLP